MKSSISLRGVYPPLTVPFEGKSESIAWGKLEANISKFNATPLAGYLVHGSNGEFCYMTKEERVELVKRVMQKICFSRASS